ncbi:hypothetical protein CONLIGDRAFT_641132 [Coniochaeta ligniaria NRRL 30616]|uniref:Uncharacterized protein n=1 Tax=Coniochaeta ligniaria NRRL 30616 TaxID=1408157 RepID=A0A1J7J3N5_9PEZI|nr:hypothetical protein CONLIGDRAFT_641132 [Coniochaeta ligniaria NRRL 30616]
MSRSSLGPFLGTLALTVELSLVFAAEPRWVASTIDQAGSVGSPTLKSLISAIDGDSTLAQMCQHDEREVTGSKAVYEAPSLVVIAVGMAVTVQWCWKVYLPQEANV